MIITEQKTLADIIESAKGASKFFLVGCGECATTCKTGGKEELEKVRLALESQGKTVTGSCVPKAPCVAGQIKIEFAKNMAAVRQADAVLVFACGLGVQSAKDNDRSGKVILPGCDSLCGAQMDAQGNFIEKCSMCGECVLDKSAAVCPVTLCPKGLMNGPCGGMNKGKCEVNADFDCAWALIYKGSQKNEVASILKNIQGPRNHKKAIKPHRIVGVKA